MDGKQGITREVNMKARCSDIQIVVCQKIIRTEKIQLHCVQLPLKTFHHFVTNLVKVDHHFSTSLVREVSVVDVDIVCFQAEQVNTAILLKYVRKCYWWACRLIGWVGRWAGGLGT